MALKYKKGRKMCNKLTQSMVCTPLYLFKPRKCSSTGMRDEAFVHWASFDHLYSDQLSVQNAD